MNREIKFRAWDSFNAEMLKPADYNGKTKELSWFFAQFEDRQKGGNEMKLMQFTGLKDKNGKEIYEGDIINLHQFLFDGFGEVERENKGEIGIDWYGVHLLTDKEETGCYLACAYGLHEESFEIIGNIYENPELI